jgi:hypothetical protein
VANSQGREKTQHMVQLMALQRRLIGSCQIGPGSHPCLLDVLGMDSKRSPRKNQIVKL